jgi:hypothetical protein
LNLSCPHLLKLAFINLHISPITTQTWQMCVHAARCCPWHGGANRPAESSRRRAAKLKI